MSDLYQSDLLRLAASADGAGRLDQPRLSATLDNPLCGDRVTMDIRVEDGQVAALAHETKACVVYQAAAAMIGRHAAGLTREKLATERQAVDALLKGEPAPEGAWPEIMLFAPVAKVKSRHVCVRLPFRAAEAAFAVTGGERS
jgi:nitrogen fixation NifU-like protein